MKTNPLIMLEWAKNNAIPIATMTGVSGSVYFWFFGEARNELVMSALWFISADIITGLMKASSWRTLSSQIAFKGLMKKFGMAFSMGFGHALDVYLFNGSNHIFKAFFCHYVIGIEVLSILENLASAGIAIPNEVQNMLRGFLLNRQNESIKKMEPNETEDSLHLPPDTGEPHEVQAK
jgi:toxin secretion/phage lysis holin